MKRKRIELNLSDDALFRLEKIKRQTIYQDNPGAIKYALIVTEGIIDKLSKGYRLLIERGKERIELNVLGLEKDVSEGE